MKRQICPDCDSENYGASDCGICWECGRLLVGVPETPLPAMSEAEKARLEAELRQYAKNLERSG